MNYRASPKRPKRLTFLTSAGFRHNGALRREHALLHIFKEASTTCETKVPANFRFLPLISGSRLSKQVISAYAVHSSHASMVSFRCDWDLRSEDSDLHHEVNIHSGSCYSTPTGWQFNNHTQDLLGLTADKIALEQETDFRAVQDSSASPGLRESNDKQAYSWKVCQVACNPLI